MGLLVNVAQATFDIEEVIREASASEKMSLLSGKAPNYKKGCRLVSNNG
jgi:hypothetical protein